jgi:ubiquinone/menaquinone biosynthesis C-methylase UbiE
LASIPGGIAVDKLIKTPAAGSAVEQRKYGNPDGYDTYMGHWSRALAPLLLRFAKLATPAALIDIGCGTGNLLAAAAEFFPRARLTGIDPSSALLHKARSRAELRGAELLEGVAERIPFHDASFDASLSLLVLQEFPDLPAALREMRRVVRPAGIVAASQWDFAKMPVIEALVDAIYAASPRMGGRLSTRSPGLVGSEAELADVWAAAGLRQVTAARVEVTRRYAGFEELWQSLLGGSTPSTLALGLLSDAERNAVRSRMQDRFQHATYKDGIEIAAEAFVVRGEV